MQNQEETARSNYNENIDSLRSISGLDLSSDQSNAIIRRVARKLARCEQSIRRRILEGLSATQSEGCILISTDSDWTRADKRHLIADLHHIKFNRRIKVSRPHCDQRFDDTENPPIKPMNSICFNLGHFEEDEVIDQEGNVIMRVDKDEQIREIEQLIRTRFNAVNVENLASTLRSLDPSMLPYQQTLHDLFLDDEEIAKKDACLSTYRMPALV